MSKSKKEIKKGALKFSTYRASLDEETQKRLYTEQKQSGTVKKSKKIYPNDPCPCGSGKKYKKCHGRNGANRFEA